MTKRDGRSQKQSQSHLASILGGVFNESLASLNCLLYQLYCTTNSPREKFPTFFVLQTMIVDGCRIDEQWEEKSNLHTQGRIERSRVGQFSYYLKKIFTLMCCIHLLILTFIFFQSSL